MYVEVFEKFVKQYHTRKFGKGELILVQGEVPSTAYVLKTGIIKTYNLTAQGEEKPISYDAGNEIFPIGWVFNQLKWSQYYYEAYTNCEVYCVPKDDYRYFLQKNPLILYETMQSFIGFYLNYQMRVNALEQSKAAAKVLNTIHYLCLRFGEDIKENIIRIKLPLTQQELANFMGLTRETTGIELKKLQRQGVLSYKRQKYIVNTAKLNEMLDEDYDFGLADVKNFSV